MGRSRMKEPTAEEVDAMLLEVMPEAADFIAEAEEAANGKARKRGRPSDKQVVEVTPTNEKTAEYRIRGTAPYVGNAFGPAAMAEMRRKQVEGSKSKKGKAHGPKDFDAKFDDCCHFSREGWFGIPANAIRKGLVSACRLVGFTMTIAKLSIFVDADGFDRHDHMPLLRVVKGKPKPFENVVYLSNGAPDIGARPMLDPGWEVRIRIRYDADQFKLSDVTNLLVRVGKQVGIGAGRADSKGPGGGCGWGHFEIVGKGGRR